jgi:hypothetical protein
VPPRLFTLAEARASLPDVRRHAEQLVAARADQLAAAARLSEATGVSAGNGHAPDETLLATVRGELERAETELAAAFRALDDVGVVVKDVDAGLVDFPSRRDGADVFLCWQVGEPELAWWHGVEEGFAGRKPI